MIYNIYLIILAISFGCSLVSFKRQYPNHLKLFSIFIGLSLITELAAFLMPKITGVNNNMQIYNLYRLPEFICVTLFFKMIIPNKYVQWFIICSWVIYPLFWAWYLFIATELGVWSGVLANIIGVYGILLSVIYLYRLYLADEMVSIKRNAEFWIAVGILFFEATSTPTFGVLLYLTQKDAKRALELVPMLTVFNIVMYIIFIYAFLCRKTKLP